MPLIRCPECGKEISETAEACPGCGHPIRGNSVLDYLERRTRFAMMLSTFLALASAVIGVVALVSGAQPQVVLGIFGLSAVFVLAIGIARYRLSLIRASKGKR